VKLIHDLDQPVPVLCVSPSDLEQLIHNGFVVRVWSSTPKPLHCPLYHLTRFSIGGIPYRLSLAGARNIDSILLGKGKERQPEAN
jgi:hypothetical protein